MSMSAKQADVIRKTIRLLRASYVHGGSSQADAREKSLKAFRDYLDQAREPRTRYEGGEALVDAVGVVSLALRGIGLGRPDQHQAEEIYSLASKALQVEPGETQGETRS